MKLSVILNDIQTLIWAGVLLYLFLRWGSGNLYELMGAVIFLGGYLFHLFWESSASYTIPYFVLLIPYAVCGMTEWEEFLEKQIARPRKPEYRRVVLGFVFCLLLIAFIRTNLFDRTIALNDDQQGIDASDQYFQRGDWETKN